MKMKSNIFISSTSSSLSSDVEMKMKMKRFRLRPVVVDVTQCFRVSDVCFCVTLFMREQEDFNDLL